MSQKRRLLRENPPKDLVDAVCRLAGWSGCNDGKWIYNTDVPDAKAEDVFTLLWPYFVPCWAKRYLVKNPSFLNIITILNFILPSVGRTIRRSVRKSKDYPWGLTWYKLDPVVEIKPITYEVSFG